MTDTPYQSWRAEMPYEKELYIKAETYSLMPPLFPDVVPIWLKTNLAGITPCHYRESADGRWRYIRRLSRGRGKPMETYYGKQIGRVYFDGAVELPALWERNDRTGEWETWMSLTPMEHFTLRDGTRRAKGTVVVAGLGMGYQVLQVARRVKVRKIILVEQSESLIDFILPALTPMLADKPLEVICGDAYKVLPGLQADVALVDIFPCYGNNGDDLQRLRRTSKGIRDWWGWGTVETGAGDREFMESIVAGFLARM